MSRYYDAETGRFINADGLASTGQGVIGYNMYAYCGNNPVLYVDSEGTRHEIGAGAVGTLPPIHQKAIYDLNNIAKETFSSPTKRDLDISVHYVGIYDKQPDKFEGTFVALGVVSLASSFIPVVGKFVILSKVMQASGILSTVYGTASHFLDDIPNKDYYQYKVTVTWSETIECPAATVTTTYYEDMYYLYDDTSYSSPSWHLREIEYWEEKSISWAY